MNRSILDPIAHDPMERTPRTPCRVRDARVDRGSRGWIEGIGSGQPVACGLWACRPVKLTWSEERPAVTPPAPAANLRVLRDLAAAQGSNQLKELARMAGARA